MRFFDYKFLILLGLTLVVYFIYREVEYLREKVDKLERAVNSNPKSIEQTENDKIESVVNSKPVLEEKKFPVLALPKMGDNLPNPNNLLTINGSLPQENTTTNLLNNELATSASKLLLENKNSSPKVISLDLISTTITGLNTPSNGFKYNMTPGIQIEHNDIILKNQVQKKINDILEQSDSDSDDTTTNISESSKHLAIYSNDNEHYDSTQNSLMESVEANKNDLKFDYNRMEIPDLKGTMESIMNNLSSDIPSEKNESSKKSPIDEIIEEKEKQLSEMIKSASINSSVPDSDSEKIKIVIGNTDSNSEDENKDVNKSKLPDEQTLNNMKLPEIKKIAETHKITITKKINGQQKPKNKNELITEILNKLNK